MPTHANDEPRFPHPAALAGFFRRERRDRVGVAELALLLGAPAAQVRDILRSEGADLRHDSTGWGEVAGYLFDAWPRARILRALGPELARSIPPAFHPAPVRWRIPPFIVRAIRHQAARLYAGDPRLDPEGAAGRFVSPSVDDYVADILFNEIQPATVTALADDRAFLEAYLYPPVD
jgi:hypothetical protein